MGNGLLVSRSFCRSVARTLPKINSVQGEPCFCVMSSDYLRIILFDIEELLVE